MDDQYNANKQDIMSLHKNSSSSWSLISCKRKELIGFPACKTWDLPKSLASYIPQPLQPYGFDSTASSNGLVLLESFCPHDCSCYVGNPVLQQWVKIPPTDYSSFVIGLVTRVDKDGVVLDFKVVRIASLTTKDYLSCTMSMCLYSSESGIWTSKIVQCSTLVSSLHIKTLNGTVYFDSFLEPKVLVSHDFYSESDQCRVLNFPDHLNHNKNNNVLTTSGGFVMYIRTLLQKGYNVFKIWRLNNDDESWQLLWDFGIIGDVVVPMAMSDIVYLWSHQRCRLVPWNLRTQKKSTDADSDDHQDYFKNQSICEYVDHIWRSTWFFQFVLPRWMEPLPRPPKVEMIDTTSLLSYISSLHRIRKRNRSNDIS